MVVQVTECLLMTTQFRSGRCLIISVTVFGEGIKKASVSVMWVLMCTMKENSKCLSVAFLMSTLIFHMRTM